MISTRRIATFIALTAGASGLGVSTASAVQPVVAPQSISVADTLDGLTTAGMPANEKAQVPTVTGQLQGSVGQLSQLHQLTDMAAPAAGLLPAVE
ncbi:hypothetical protein [Streptomyces fuscigenes]|uniref:hypothetical protein n=1 Tax=Streptomyces fuscigenes TaxID=1528880 RepID=UPI001F44B309|nr:hypothetical protein [Streptomyces fuscigenes]MCF3962873.1 hypothetical protein [Streptomyces fuscigenes]